MDTLKTPDPDHLDDSLYSDADLTTHLRDKIRQQAARLRSLEQYRILCERRIQELCPSHPLPVKEDHRQSVISVSQELHLAQEKIQRLETQLSSQAIEPEDIKDNNDYILLLEKYNELLKDKTDLEESLRAEMLNCEEQRTYIELLKQTIEGKLEEINGISLDAKAMSVLSNSRSRADDSRREQSRMRNTILDYESQIKRLTHKVKTRESENEMLVKEREELDSHLRQAAEALQIAEEEVAKLEEEKISMMDYVSQSTSKEREMEKELNDLSKYFEDMKKDFQDTLKTLEIMKNKEARHEAEKEVHQDEIIRTSQLYNEMQGHLETLKKNLAEKENFIRTIKEEKNSAELRIEKLQANVSSLTESLKETQMNASRIQEQLDDYSKTDLQKSETFSRLKSEHLSLYQENVLFKDKLIALNKELENSRKAYSELEKIRELDLRQLQDFKAKLLDLQARNEILEGFKRSRNESDQIRRSEQSRAIQLEEEVQYLTESLRDLQQRENIASQGFNEVKILNAKLSNQIEELYLENDSYRLELDKKMKETDLYVSKFNHLNEYYESVESDKNELQEMLAAEKASVKHFKDLLDDGKSQNEEMRKIIENCEISQKKLEKITEEREEEIKTLKLNLKSIEREIEDEKKDQGVRVLEFKEKSSRVEMLEKEIEAVYLEVASCCKVISGFCGKLTISYNDYRSCLTLAYKEFLDTWTEGNRSNINSITCWVMNTIEEIQSLSKSLFQTNKALNQSSNDLNKLQVLLNESSSNETIYKQHAIKLKNELEELYRKNEAIIEQSDEEIHNLRYEIADLKHEIMSLTSDKFSLSEALKSALAESQSLKISNEFPVKNYREKIVYSKEALIKQVQRDIAMNREELKEENERERVRKNMICNKEHSPSSCPYLHLAGPDKPRVRQKMQFS